ncbi:MAG: T9SS type A sorting domain-containing protein [Bacteroidales bacterium]
MKKLATLFFFIAFTVSAFAQLERMIDFEGGEADTAWRVFANGPEGSNEDISIVLNPFKDDVNDSDSVLSFYVRETSDRWVGMYTDYDVMTSFTEDNHILAMMVWKEMVSPTALKVELSLTGSDVVSVYATNTKTEEWELILYEFTDAIGHYYERLTMFPEFPETAEESRDYLPSTIYIDNIGVPQEDNTSVKEIKGIEMMLYPTPAEFRMAVVYPGMTAITLSDIMGRKIRTLSFPITDSKVIETGDLNTGIYFVTADTRDGRITMRFMKK